MLAEMEGFHFFTGENAYALRSRVRFWTTEFVRKHGEENFLRVYGDDIGVRELIADVSSAPFIAEKRLVVLEGLPSALDRDMAALLLREKHDDVILLIVEAKPDKRLGAVKDLMAAAHTEEFAPLSPAQMRTWALHRVAELGCDLPSNVLDVLLERVGDDQAFLDQELQKLALYATGRPVTTQDIDAVVLCLAEREIWALMDIIGTGDVSAALSYCDRLLRQGESAHGLWAIFLWMLSSMTPIKGAIEEGITSPPAVAKQCGVSFGSARAMIPAVKKLSRSDLFTIVASAAEYDVQLKTGGFKATVEEPQELRAIIDRMIVACCA